MSKDLMKDFDPHAGIMSQEDLDFEFDDYIRCTACNFVGLVRPGQDACPNCGEESLQDEPKPEREEDFLSGVQPDAIAYHAATIRRDFIGTDGEAIPVLTDACQELPHGVMLYAAPVIAQDDAKALQAIHDVILSYLKPDGISRRQAMLRIIGIMDPDPTGEHRENPTVEPGLDTPPSPILYQHSDGRHGLCLHGHPAAFTEGDPGWYRVPIDIVEPASEN